MLMLLTVVLLPIKTVGVQVRRVVGVVDCGTSAHQDCWCTGEEGLLTAVLCPSRLLVYR